jgi:hypothetical protein
MPHRRRASSKLNFAGPTTDVAIALRDKLQPLLEGMSLILANPQGFEPGKSERGFCRVKAAESYEDDMMRIGYITNE